MAVELGQRLIDCSSFAYSWGMGSTNTCKGWQLPVGSAGLVQVRATGSCTPYMLSGPQSSILVGCCC